MTGELISIIVPVYQVEEYIDMCILSIQKQTYSSLEILLIDDGSTDESGRICDYYESIDSRIRVIHQQNKGLAEARNVGLKNSHGTYLAFIDADDYISPQYIEILYELCCQYQADIAVCEYFRTRKNRNIPNRKREQIYWLTSEQMLQEWHGVRKRIETVVWNKLYRRELLLQEDHEIWFPKGKIHEDVYISHLIVCNANKVVITNQVLYAYRIREDSITEKKGSSIMTIQQNIEAQMERLSFFAKKNMVGSYWRNMVGLCLHACLFWWRKG